jgi:hypothetical protein
MAVSHFSPDFYAFMKFAFPTLGKEPDFVVHNAKVYRYTKIQSNLPWVGSLASFLRRQIIRLDTERGLHTYGMQISCIN